MPQPCPYPVYYVKCTPELAAEILEHSNPKNRNIRPKRVEGMTQHILADNWVLTGTTTFVTDGVLLDGQHRLASCVEANRSIDFLCTLIPPDEAKRFNQFIDRNIGRNFGDYLHFEDVPDHKKVAPILHRERAYLKYEDPCYKMAVSEDQNWPGMLRLYHEIEHDLKRGLAIIPPGLRKNFRVTEVALQWVALQLVAIDETKAADFLKLAASPGNLPADHPCAALQRKLLDVLARKGDDRHRKTREDMVLLVRAWNLYYGNKTASPQGIRYRKDDPFPCISGQIRTPRRTEVL